MEYKVNRKVWQVLWSAILPNFGYHDSHFENDVFEIKPYRWDDEKNDYHFYHKPSGFKIEWYKYALRGASCNIEITDEQFVDILYDCKNSLEKGSVRFLQDVDRWWDK